MIVTFPGHTHLFLSATSHVNCIDDLINVGYLTECLYQVMMTLHFLNDIINDVESTRKTITTS